MFQTFSTISEIGTKTTIFSTTSVNLAIRLFQEMRNKKFDYSMFYRRCCCCCLNSGGIEDPKRVPSLVGRFNHPLKCVCVCVYVSFYVSVLYDNGVVSNSVYLFEV